MSTEYRPVFAIQFSALDKRLEKYGIKVDISDHNTALTGPNGILVATPEGESIHCERKLRVDTEAVLNAIQTEYGIEIVDENDHAILGLYVLGCNAQKFRNGNSIQQYPPTGGL